MQVHDGVVLPDAIADDTWRVNLKGLWNVLDVAQRSETVERVVHVGERPVLRSEPRRRRRYELTVCAAARRLLLDGVAWLHVPPRSRLRRLQRGRAPPRR